MIDPPSTRKPPRTLLLAAVATACLLIGSGCTGDRPSGDDTAAAAPGTPLATGQQTYQTYCMSCHGAEGKGDGPVAEVLSVPLNDLSQLRARNDGTFPVDLIYASIDGRDSVKAHGTREMPVWGNIWSDIEGKPVKEAIVQQRINELVEYIRSIQTDSL